MATDHYSKFDVAELILRDQLAIDRTLLANERTLLSYLRSGVALFIAGISIIHFRTLAGLPISGTPACRSGSSRYFSARPGFAGWTVRSPW